MSNKIVWLSVDPVKKKVDFYPYSMAERIEKVYNDYHINKDYTVKPICILGKDFFNATVHIDNIDNFYQTTPEFNIGRNSYKKPGFRSVRRINLAENNNVINVYSLRVNGEWRIVNNALYSEITFTVDVPDDVILKTNVFKNSPHCPHSSPSPLTIWNPNELEDPEENADILNKNVIIWQWCFGIKEKQGNLMKLDDKWWIPYLYLQNKKIEYAFSNNLESTIINLDNINNSNSSERVILFDKNSCFGWQKNYSEDKVRLIRRNIITIKNLIDIFKNNNYKLTNPNDIPHEFYCSITQDIMKDPVKTNDGFTYEREAIEKWLSKSNKSPLTGLNLSSKTLTPNYELKTRIVNMSIN